MSTITTFGLLSSSTHGDTTNVLLSPSASLAEPWVQGTPLRLLRLEAAALFVTSLFAFRAFDGSWWMFVAFFLVPDLAMLGYLAGPQWGARAYNAAHTLTIPLILGVLAALNEQWSWLPILTVWTAHIGFDRMLGYGLKYGNAFGSTHLGRIGRYRAGVEPEGGVVD